jgi:hypothetical protein
MWPAPDATPDHWVIPDTLPREKDRRCPAAMDLLYAALRRRGLDFVNAAHVFVGVTFEIEDTRKNHGEKRIICYGYRAAA